MRIRVAVLCVALALCLSAAEAKLVSVKGQGVIRGTPPPNVIDKNPNDQSSEFKNGLLAITGFDEKLGVVLPHDIAISTDPAVTLQAGVPYDSFFLFFHLKVSSSVNEASATATFIVDNRVVGCTVGNNAEFETTQYFGVPQTVYPLSTSDLANPGLRGYEDNDGVNGAGTAYISNNTIRQPGDYTRCFTATCSDSQGNPCQCSASLNQCIQSSDDYKCFTDASELLALNNFQFSSTCRVSSSSLVAEFGACNESNGCKIHNGAVCLSGQGSSVELKITAGCDCAKTIVATFPAGPAGRGCLVPDTTIPQECKNSSKVLVYGQIDSTWIPWFQANIPGTDVTHDAALATITQAYFQQFDLVIVAQLGRMVSAAESQATLDYLNGGGAVIALAGFVNTLGDRQYQEAIFQSLGIHYGGQLITLGQTLNYNPNNPLSPGLAPGFIDFVGGWASTAYTGPGTTEFFASGVSIYDQNTYSIGQTITLPSGGRIVTWGDEWVTFTGRYGDSGNVDAQFWKNAVAWVSKICVPGTSPCSTENFVVSTSCDTASHSSTGKGFTFSFSNTVSNCN